MNKINGKLDFFNDGSGTSNVTITHKSDLIMLVITNLIHIQRAMHIRAVQVFIFECDAREPRWLSGLRRAPGKRGLIKDCWARATAQRLLDSGS